MTNLFTLVSVPKINLLFVATIVAIIEITFGVLGQDNCHGAPLIPQYMLLRGVFTLLGAIFFASYLCGCERIHGCCAKALCIVAGLLFLAIQGGGTYIYYMYTNKISVIVDATITDCDPIMGGIGEGFVVFGNCLILGSVGTAILVFLTAAVYSIFV